MEITTLPNYFGNGEGDYAESTRAKTSKLVHTSIESLYSVPLPGDWATGW